MKRKGIIHSILLRYMISYAAVMAVLFFGVGVYMNNTYTNTIRANTVENNINKLGKIRYQHEANLTTLLSVGRQIGLSPYTRNASAFTQAGYRHGHLAGSKCLQQFDV